MIHKKHDTVSNSLLEIFFVLRMRYNNSIFQETKLPLKMHRPIFRLLFVVPTKFTARRTAYHAIYEANEISLRQKFGYTYNFQTYRDDATLNQQRKQWNAKKCIKKKEREENNKRKKREDLADIQIMRTVYDVEYKMDRRASTFFPDGARGIYRSLFWQGGIARTKEVLREYLIYTENTRASDRGKKCNFAESFLRSPTLWASAGTRSVHDDLVDCVSDDNFRMLSQIL